MNILKRASKPVIILFFVLILLLMVLDINKDYENDILLLILNTVFVGLMPLAVAVFSARIYYINGIRSALLISCGMLAFGMGAIIAGWARLLPESANYSVTSHNLSVCLCAALHLAASVNYKVYNDSCSQKARAARLFAGYFSFCAFLAVVISGAISGFVPEFFGKQGSTDFRNIIMCIAISMCFGAAVAFQKQSKYRETEYLYWYSCSLLLISMGLLAVTFSKIIGSPLTWAGRICQFLGCCYALVSVAEIVRHAKIKGVTSLQIMADFFTGAETNYKILVENLSSAVVNADADSNVFFTNTAAQRLFQCNEANFQSLPFIESMICEPYRMQLKDDIEACKASGVSKLAGKLITVEAADRLGRVFPAELSFSVCMMSTGFAFCYVVRDISEQVSQQEKLTKQAEELQQKNKLTTEFFTNISHEFRTPLTIILNAIEMTENRLADTTFEHKARVQKNLAIMRQNSHRLLRLIANLLDVTKTDTGFLQPHLANIDVKEWMHKLVESVVDYAAKRDIEVTLVDELNIVSMPMDGEILDRIMLNLLSNAVKHTDKGGHITVRMEEAFDRIIISVEDDGEGIPDDRKDLVFDRFRQVDTSMTRASPGSGIGLALTKSLVELLGGSIRFESTFGAGTKFCVELPILEKAKRTAKPIVHGLKLNRKVEMEFSDIL